jgi:hypothetical protein
MITFKGYLREMARKQYAVVDEQGKRHFMTDDEKSAARVAKEKGMKVVQKFFAKDKKPDVIAVNHVT